MPFTRRDFIRGGVSAFTFSFAAPAFLSDLARAQGTARRNLVVLYLSGGNDALSMVVPYTDAQYYARRPVLGIPAANVLQIGRDSAGNALGLNPRLTGLKSIFDCRPARVDPAHRLPELEPLALPGHRHLGHGQYRQFAGPGLAWPLSRHDPVAGRSAGRVVDGEGRAASAAGEPRRRGGDPERRRLLFSPPNGNTGTEANFSRLSATRIASHIPVDMPHLAFVNGTAQQAFATLDKVAAVGTYRPAMPIRTTGSGRRCRPSPARW